ncbi:MAG: hypothetical protein R3Y32_07735 [Bacillota bacterium]
MKKTMKRIVALALVLCLSLSLFAGCEGSVKTSDEYLLSEYGMTFEDSSSVYTGEAQTVEVSVGSVASGKSYSVTYVYEKNGSTVSQAIDAGTYEVIAEISDDSGEIYYLTSDFTITTAGLYIDIPDQYVRKGSDATDVKDVLADLELLGDDTIADLGLSWDVDNIDDIDAMTEVSEGIALGVESSTSNYSVTVSKGVLYVLSYADYTAVGTLALDISNLVSYNDRFDELTYSENSAYSSAAKRVLDIFDNSDDYTAIQLNMLGDVDEATLTSNKALADKRTSQGYSLDWDTEGEIKTSEIDVDTDALVFEAVLKYEGWSSDSVKIDDTISVKDDDGETSDEARFYVDNGFVIDYDGRDDEDEYDYEKEVVYGDYFYFVIQDYNNEENTDAAYIITTLYVRNKEVDYDDGKSYTLSDGNDYMVYKLRADSTTLGAIGTSSSIDITVEAVSKYYVNGIDVNEESNAAISLMYIESDDDYALKYSASNHSAYSNGFSDSISDSAAVDSGATNTYNYFVSGELYELEIYMMDGFTVSEITIGDDLVIDGSEIVDNKVEFYVTEDTFGVDAGEAVDIYVDTVKSFDFGMKISDRTVRTSDEDGTYETDDGTVLADGLNISGTSATIVEGDVVEFQFIPADDFYVTSVMLYAAGVDFDDDNNSAVGYIELIEEVSSDGYLTIDFSEDCDYFDFEDIEGVSELYLYVTFAEKYEFEVISDDVTFKQNSAGEWVSDYGVISVLNVDEELIDSIAKGDLFVVYAELEPGYVISSIKVNSTYTSNIDMTQTKSDDLDYLSTYAEEIFDDGEMYFFANSLYNTSSPSLKNLNNYTLTPAVGDTGTVKNDDKDDVANPYSVYYNSDGYRLDAGEAVTIEVTFDQYYELDMDDGLRSGSSLTYSGNFYYTENQREMIIFADDDSDDLYVTITLGDDWLKWIFKESAGFDYSKYNSDQSSSLSSDDYDDAVDEVIFWLECEGEELDDVSYSGSKIDRWSEVDALLGSSPTLSLSVEFGDLMDLVEPGDVIVVYVEYDVEYE